MKTKLSKITKLFFALLIPMSMLVGCNEEDVNPMAGPPSKEKVVKRPGQE